MKILIADDNHFYRKILATTVAEWGYEVVAASDGDMACELLLEKNAPKIAILDWMMPGKNGLEVCKKIRAHKSANPPYIIILTARDAKEDLVAALRCGSDDYLTKPFDHEELHARLQVGVRIVTLQEKLSERVDKLENALSEAQKLEAVGRLAGGIAHDFNNILTIINGYCELLLGDFLQPQDSPKAIEVIREASERGASLTRQLLAFARKQALRPVPLSLNTCVASVQKLSNRVIGEDICVSTHLDGNLHQVEADPGQLEQVLLNLLFNARDAMPQGGAITLATADTWVDSGTPGAHPGVPEGSYAMMSVTDTGTGMNENTKARLFEPFFTTKDVGKGTGLGLATAYGIIRQSGGFIAVESEPGAGATFRIYLPHAKGSVPIARPVSAPVKTRAGGETVLLVEDEETVRRLLRVLLSNHGYQILEASNGEEALRTAKDYQGPIHLLLTDIIMPGINGYETSRRVAALRPEIKALYISGYSEEAIHRPSDSADRRLQKPLSSDTLVGAIREILDQPVAPVMAQ